MHRAMQGEAGTGIWLWGVCVKRPPGICGEHDSGGLNHVMLKSICGLFRDDSWQTQDIQPIQTK